MNKQLAIASLLVIFFITGCSSNPVQSPFNPGNPLITVEEAELLRLSTYNECQNLLGQREFTGTVLYEQCNKNCLGGCPNSGPAYCFYGVQDSNGCLVYTASRITAFRGYPEEIYQPFTYGSTVTVPGNITLYDNYYCIHDDPSRHDCYYFLIQEVEEPP